MKSGHRGGGQKYQKMRMSFMYCPLAARRDPLLFLIHTPATAAATLVISPDADATATAPSSMGPSAVQPPVQVN